MTNRKNYNSILFLTVYLGLVLVGGSSQVFAHAASNALFELRNEIEFKEDLENKPDDEKINFKDSLEDYFDDVESFLKELHTLQKAKKFNLNSDRFEIKRQLNVACKIEGCATAQSNVTSINFGNSGLETAVTEISSIFDEWAYLSDCSESEVDKYKFSTSSKAKILFNTTELKIEVSAPKISKKRADFLTANFNQVYKTYRVTNKKTAVKVIRENTKITSQNNQVFIVTRLPRGSIDSLLKQ